MQQRWRTVVVFALVAALCSASSRAQDYNHLYSFGINDSGSLGLSGTTSTSTPTLLNFNKNVVRAASGLHFTILVTDDLSSQLWAFGSNAYRQLGIGDDAADPAYGEVVPVTYSTGFEFPILEIAAGDYHVIIRGTNNILWAWGRNDQGQLGIGGTTSASVPTLVDMSYGLWSSTVAKIVSGSSHSLALDTNGNLFCWGSNQYGQCGAVFGQTYLDRPNPVYSGGTSALSGKRVLTMAAGVSHTLAITTDGLAVAFGAGAGGVLGTGSTSNSVYPTFVLTTGVLSGVTLVEAAASSAGASIVRSSDGRLFGWGNRAMLGVDISGSTVNSPVEIPRGELPLSKARQLCARANALFVVTVDGDVYSLQCLILLELGNSGCLH
eukprot:TRINITY_DN3420_c0_g3_i1.p2 TRINITY_DN3420_c0_g3~~TRINITY_DN3420_c0_g3_i1.p2  ORF type:complete len:380 (-),score=60.47 TRINITY_DN3420_c0_g3_i1:1391-2530(-)